MEPTKEFNPTNIKVLIACKVTFDLDGEEVTTLLYARDNKSAINQAVNNKRESLKAAEKRIADTATQVESTPQLDNTLEKATDMATESEPNNATA